MKRLLALLILSTSLIACGPEDENNATENNSTSENNSTTVTNPLAGDADAAAAGETKFKTTCQGCHGVTGESSAFAKDKALKDTAANATDAYIFNFIADGAADGSMSGYRSQFSDTEIWQLVTYIRTYAE